MICANLSFPTSCFAFLNISFESVSCQSDIIALIFYSVKIIIEFLLSEKTQRGND